MQEDLRHRKLQNAKEQENTHVLSADLALLRGELIQSLGILMADDITRAWIDPALPEQVPIQLLEVPQWIYQLASEEKDKLFLTHSLHTIAEKIKQTEQTLHETITNTEGTKKVGTLIGNKVIRGNDISVLVEIRLGTPNSGLSIRYDTSHDVRKNRISDKEPGYAAVSIIRYEGMHELDTPTRTGGLAAIVNNEGHIINNDIRHITPDV